MGLVRAPLAGAVSRHGGLSLERVAQRMRYWRDVTPGSLAKPSDKAARKYLVLEQDGAGVNNKRIGWEMAGVVALHVGRTLVLPPNEVWWAIDVNGTTTKTEDFINLDQLRGGLPVLTFKEFAQKERQALGLPDWTVHDELDGQQRGDWKAFALANFRRPGSEQTQWCDLSSYSSDEAVIYADHYPDGRLLNCERWWSLGEPEFTEGQKPWPVPDAAYALLRNGFVWHEDVFKLAAPIVRELGLFRYVALHARFNDFKEFDPAAVQSAEGILAKWGPKSQVPQAGVAFIQTGGGVVTKAIPGSFLATGTRRARMRADLVLKRIMHWVKPGTVLYISTDETDESFLRAFKERGVDARWSRDFFERDDSPIAELVKKDRLRAEKLRGCVEQVICAFSQLFLGTSKSTFSGYITRMRIYADAPQRGLSERTRLFHTDTPTPELAKAVQQEIDDWEARGGLLALNRSSPGAF